MLETFSVINKTKGNLPLSELPFQAIKNRALGEDYNLELVFLDEKESRDLNLKYKNKNKPTNVLSFPLTAQSGQIFICPTYAEKEAPKFKRNYDNYIVFLFIHGVIHLKGYDHSSRMESEERKIREKFGI